MPSRPLAGNPRVTCDHVCHTRRTPPSGGTDYGVDVGTPVYAPVAGRYYHNNNAFAGWGLYVNYQGRQIFLSHLSARTAASGTFFDEGQQVARSGGARGAPGAGSSTGPHLHAEVVNVATRQRGGMEEWLTAVNGPSFAGGNTTPIGGDMPLTQDELNFITNTATATVQQVLGIGPYADRDGTVAKVLEAALRAATASEQANTNIAFINDGPGNLNSLDQVRLKLDALLQRDGTVSLTPAQVSQIAAAVNIDVDSLITAITDAFPTVPTAEQNGAAARAAIVK